MSKLRTKTCARPTFWGLHTAPKSSGHDSIGYLFRVRVRTRAAAARSNTNADIYLLFIWLIAINLALKTQNVFLRRYTSDRHEAKDDVLLTQLFDLNPMIERWSALRCFQCVRCVYANVIETCARERAFEYTADVRFAREGFRIRTAIKRSLSMHCPVDVKKKRILILIDGEWLLLFLRCIARRYFGISPINIPAASAQCVCVRCGGSLWMGRAGMFGFRCTNEFHAFGQHQFDSLCSIAISRLHCCRWFRRTRPFWWITRWNARCPLIRHPSWCRGAVAPSSIVIYMRPWTLMELTLNTHFSCTMINVCVRGAQN